ncbi:MAG: hypothetical protein WCI74_10315, partial [Actinomycetes bacterium]
PTAKAPAKQTRVTLGTVSACALRDTTTSASRLSCSVNDPVNYAAYRGQAYVCAPANAWTAPAFFAPLSHVFKGSATLCDNWKYLEAASQRQPSLRTQLAYDTCSNFSIVSWAKGSWYLARDSEDVSVFSWSSSHLLVGLQCAVLDVGADAPEGYWPASHNCVQAAGAYAVVRPTRAGGYADFNLAATLSVESPSGSSAPLPCWGLTTTTKLPAEIAERPLTVLFNPSWEDSGNASRNTRMATISRGFGNLLASPAFVPALYNQNWRWDDKALVSGALWYAEGWGTFVP